MMTTKVKPKGILKGGLKYISQIFDDDKGQEMQIGNPTDVKHVAHIGWDGPAVENPSWMKDYNSSNIGFSAPLGPPTESKESPEVKWVSEDSKRAPNKGGSSSPQKGGTDEVPRSSRRNSDDDNNNNASESPRKQKPKQSRRSQQANKDPPDKSSQESNSSIPNVPRKSRRKKSTGVEGGSSTRSKTKSLTSNDAENNENSDLGQGLVEANPTSIKPQSRLGEGERNENRVTFKD